MFWGFGGGNLGLEQMRQELEQMQRAYGAAFQLLLGLAPARVTPADEILTREGQKLLRYRRADAARHATPVLLVPSLLNQASLLDLAANRSLVQYFLDQGFAVFGLEWQSPTSLNPALSFDFYVEFLQESLLRVCAESGQEQLSLLGHCSGGTLSAISAALWPERVRNLVQLAAPIDFHDGGLLSQWLRFGIGDPDLTLSTLALLPQPLMRASMQMLKPTLQIAQQVALYHQLGDDGGARDLLALQAWLGDSAFFPLEAYRTLIKACYRQNALVKGQFSVAGQLVDLHAIQAALLIVTAVQDRICPPASAQALAEHASSQDSQLIALPGNHLSLLAGRSATHTLWPQLAAWLEQRSA